MLRQKESKVDLGLQAFSAFGIDHINSSGFVGYEEAVATLNKRVEGVTAGQIKPLIWFLQHPSLYTAGPLWVGDESVKVKGKLVPFFRTQRGGQMTYHGPGQRIVYVVLPLRHFGLSISSFLSALGTWVQKSLESVGVPCFYDDKQIGVWVTQKGHVAQKVASIGLRVRKGVVFHGVALNIDPDMDYFGAIKPCGLQAEQVTSLKNTGYFLGLDQVDQALYKSFNSAFGSLISRGALKEAAGL